ncbi:DUF4181 domain-containing protein [Peribacillus sp. SI8-4]|uniref:DUF4181 domain-containing protein n=1 Tax=Peribacillus sp. SI8-4 TaxID=3048009 RepID=UPI002554917F|nr:DUF4181 domain-containing protein [Peribacillus sp. SI8-4]
MELVWMFVILISVMFFIDKVLRKWLGVKKKKISETPGKNIDRWGRGSILVLYLCILPFVIEDSQHMKMFICCYFIVLMGFQLAMERLYLKNKEYMLTLANLLFILMFFYYIDYFI